MTSPPLRLAKKSSCFYFLDTHDAIGDLVCRNTKWLCGQLEAEILYICFSFLFCSTSSRVLSHHCSNATHCWYFSEAGSLNIWIYLLDGTTVTIDCKVNLSYIWYCFYVSCLLLQYSSTSVPSPFCCLSWTICLLCTVDLPWLCYIFQHWISFYYQLESIILSKNRSYLTFYSFIELYLTVCVYVCVCVCVFFKINYIVIYKCTLMHWFNLCIYWKSGLTVQFMSISIQCGCKVFIIVL